uniref:Putative oxysterol-binding protein 1 n=1 Tax=Amblyomma aureolatum TaxID=187763 RepID=A0A1E1X9K1_9ACAR
MSNEASQQQQQGEPEMKGWLAKWTNYLKGYQKRWFVLSNGLLSYYRNQAEMAHTCRGTISLVSAVIHTEDSCNFVISNGGTQTFHLKASNEIERQKWVTALELAKARAVRMMESEEDDELDMPSQLDKCELLTVLRLLHVKLEDLSMCSELINKHGTALQRSLSELEQLDPGGGAAELATRVRAVNERATLFRITSTAMMNACSEYVQLAQSQGRKWVRMLQHEHEQCLRLQEMVEQLAKQHSSLERAAQEASGAHSDDDEFFDAPEHSSPGGEHHHFLASEPPAPHRPKHRRSASGLSSGPSDSDSELEPPPPPPVSSPSTGPTGVEDNVRRSEGAPPPPAGGGRKRRTRISEKPSCSLSLWSIMKNCIGKELTKIPMPVNFNEPLSTLQRLTEDYEYSELLDRAAQCGEDAALQLVYVAAFAVSSYATTANRTGKPFNPLLGETYECDRRDDFGWRSISEQVSHHPPMLAQYCEGRGWRCWQEFSMSSKFRGKYLQVVPLGVVHLDLAGSHFTWRKVTTVVHNIIVGKLWVDHQGDMEIRNHTRGHVARLKFHPYSYFSREPPRRVTGLVSDAEGAAAWLLQGNWDGQLECARVLSAAANPAGAGGRPLVESGSLRVIWKRRLPGAEYERMYNFTVLACQLNEPEDGVAPTDSRLRPDQRLMEEGNWDEANQVKLQLEEKQRATRRQRETEAEAAAAQGRPYVGYEPVWFRKETDPITGNPIHVYQNEYWACKEQGQWDRCPTIYLSS